MQRMKFDTPTVVAISVVIDFSLTLILLHTWRTRTTYSGFALWIVGTACWSVGSLLSMLFSTMQPQFVPKIIGNALIMLHPLLLYEGIRLFHGIRRRWWNTPLNGALVLGGTICVAYFFLITSNLVVRSVCINTVLAVLFGRICVEPLFYNSVRRYSMQWLLSASLLPLVAMLFIRAWTLYTLSPLITFSAMLTNEALLHWIMFYGAIAELFIAYSYLSLTSDRVEDELRVAQVRERNIAEAQRQFFGMVTHEFKTPLAVINRSAQMIAYTAALQDEALIKRVNTIRENSVNLINLLDACMNDAVMARGELHLEPADVDLTALLDSARQYFFEVCPERKIELTVPDTPQKYHGDERLLFHLIVNLMDNAIKFSALPITVRLERTAEAFCLTVTDQGIGIPAGEISNLGERTFRATTAKEISGTGIGLHTARLIATLHQGTITFDSPQGKGTTVTVMLPLCRYNPKKNHILP